MAKRKSLAGQSIVDQMMLLAQTIWPKEIWPTDDKEIILSVNQQLTK
jgi:hypothetical protein